MSIPSQQEESSIENSNRQMTAPNVNVNQIVQNYFHKKGYTQGELAFIQQQETLPQHNLLSLKQLSKKFIDSTPPNIDISSLPEYLKLIKQDPEVSDIDTLLHDYEKLREWMSNALDIYKDDLLSVLYPTFVYTFLNFISTGLINHGLDFFQAYKHEHVEKHGTEIELLGIIKSADDVKNNKIANLYLNNKFHIHMSSIPFELFFHYIQENKLTRLIRIVNQHFHVHLITSKLSPASAGGSTEKKEGITTHEHNHPLDRLHESTTSTPLHIYNKDNEDKDIMHKIKEEEQQSSLDQRNIVGMATVSFRSADIQAELDSLSDLRKRVSMGSAAPPSVCIYTFHNTHNLLNCITISEDATLVAGGFSESYIKIWSLKGEKLQDRKEKDANEPGTDYKKLIGHSGPVYGISFSHDNQYLVSSSGDQTVRLWCLNTFTNLVCYKSHNYPVWDVDFGPYGFYFATASHDKTARLWSCDHIDPLRIFAGHLSDVNTVKFHPNSKYVVTGSSDKTARLWDVQRGTCVRVFTGHTGSVHCVAISPNGRLMASGGEDQTIILWDLGTGKRLKAMTGHTGFIYSLSFSSDSAVLVSGSADGTVRAWDVNRDTPYQNMFEGSDSKKRTKYDKSNGKQQQQQQQQQKESKKDAEKIKAVNSNDLSNDNAKRKKGVLESNDQLSAFATKNTPIYTVQFTQRNLCLAAGAMSSLSLDL